MKSLLGMGLLATALAAAPLIGAPHATGTRSPMTPAQRVQRARQAVIVQKLNLTEDQKAQARRLRATLEATIKATRANEALAPEKRQELVAAARKTAQEPWRAVLTPEQKTTLDELTSHPHALNALAQQRARANRVGEELGLTPEQRAEIRDLHNAAVALTKPIRADATLTAAQKNAKLREVFQASRQEVQAVLTPKQQAKLSQIRQRLLAPLGPLGH